MKIAVMQPYLFPYIGYFQLIAAVDAFVIYDNIEFTKKGWINRNRILVNGKDDYFTLPLKKDSDFLHVNQRTLAETYAKDRSKMIGKISECYKKAPFYQTVFPLIESTFSNNAENLFAFILNSVEKVIAYLEIPTRLIISSSLEIDHSLKSEQKVIAICKALHANNYLNASGGVDLYSKTHFDNNGIQLQFIKSNPIIYRQFENEFIPWLSIIDVMMFNSKEKIREYLNDYSIFNPIADV